MTSNATSTVDPTASPVSVRIEALLSARLFVAPRLVDRRLYFVSNLSGRLSLYVMDDEGGVPEPLLPPDIALQNPHLIQSYAFEVFPRLDAILVMLDSDGDEVYQPMLIPREGGFPRPAFGSALDGLRVSCTVCDVERNIVYLSAESQSSSVTTLYRGDLATGALTKLTESSWPVYVTAASAANDRALVLEQYTIGDAVLSVWTEGRTGLEILYGVPLDSRAPDERLQLNGLDAAQLTADEKGILLITSVFDDSYGLGYVDIDTQGTMSPVDIDGAVHQGQGELDALEHVDGDRFTVRYNIDGASWLYEGYLDRAAKVMRLAHVLCGQGVLANGVLEHSSHDEATDRYTLSFSTATSPTQLYIVEGQDREVVRAMTREKVLGVAPSLLSPGEDASFASFDGKRISARLYRPADGLGYHGPRPLVYYVHGGPQSQERPDFAWFSMPLIQFLTLNGFAVFVPNVRGSTGYGLAYTKLVDHDWGGDDRLDHVHAMKLLGADAGIDTSRAGVMGRSYGGYMTLTLATRHPDLWSAAVDMFGPYSLLDFSARIPATWKPYFAEALGDPVRDREFLVERSPSTYIDALSCPLLVVQGQNDPRVVESESRNVVERLRGQGKTADYLLFPDEGHDVLKYANRVACYGAITDFFRANLHP